MGAPPSQRAQGLQRRERSAKIPVGWGGANVIVSEVKEMEENMNGCDECRE